MFGKKIPGKVMGTNGVPPEQENRPMESKGATDRSATPSARAESPPRRPNSRGVETVLGADSVIVGGKIISKGTMRIDGRIEAEIEAEDTIVVGTNGVVKANIKARNIAVSGKVLGNIIALERLELQPTSEVLGDVKTAPGALIIEGGAKLEGRCIMGLSKKPEDTAQLKKPPEAHEQADAAPQQDKKD